MSLITWACLRYVQELATILGPQNHTQGSCALCILSKSSILSILFNTYNTANTANRANILNLYVGSSILLEFFSQGVGAAVGEWCDHTLVRVVMLAAGAPRAHRL